jgi:HEAT repeat protein
VPDEAVGRNVERFVTHPSPSVRRAAATALASLAGFGARGALTELLGGSDDGVRLGALAGLRRVKGIDAPVVALIDKILSGLAGGGEELRAAASAALADACPEVRSTALGTLARVVRVQRKSFVGLLKDAIAAPQEPTMVLLASARSLIVLGGDKGKEQRHRRECSSSSSKRCSSSRRPADPPVRGHPAPVRGHPGRWGKIA